MKTPPISILLAAAATAGLAELSAETLQVPVRRSKSRQNNSLGLVEDHPLIGKTVLAGGYRGVVLEVHRVMATDRLRVKFQMASGAIFWDWEHTCVEVES